MAIDAFAATARALQTAASAAGSMAPSAVIRVGANIPYPHFFKALTVKTGGGLVSTGAIGAAAAGVIPVVAQVGVFVALGAPYLEARKIIEDENNQAGFSQGWVMGLLFWEWRHVIDRFAMVYLRMNRFDEQADVIRVKAYNLALHAGWLAGFYELSMNDKGENLKDVYLRELRRLAGGVSKGNWSRNEQISYVIALSSAARRFGIVVAR